MGVRCFVASQNQASLTIGTAITSVEGCLNPIVTKVDHSDEEVEFLSLLAILRVVCMLLTASAKPLLMLLSYHARIPFRREYMFSDAVLILGAERLDVVVLEDL